MPEPRTTTPTGAALHADAQRRGTGARSSPAAGAPGAGPPTVPGPHVGAPIDRPVARETLRLLVAETATHQAHARSGRRRYLAGRPSVADDLAAPARTPDEETPSPELLRLLAQLRATIGRYARERRDAGVTVERVVPEVRGLVGEGVSMEGWIELDETLSAQVVRWAIEAYYDQAEQAHGPCFF